jgi:hypothetical protein
VALVTFPDGRATTFVLSGDQGTWTPTSSVANILGLHTAYELDRIGGRYIELEHERDSARAIFSLTKLKRVDMFTLRRRWSAFAPLLDTEYGGTFVTAEGGHDPRTTAPAHRGHGARARARPGGLPPPTPPDGLRMAVHHR